MSGHTKKWNQKQANALVRKLNEGDLAWTTRVWQNLGWHYEARSKCGRFAVSETRYDGPPRYTAYLNRPNAGGGKWVGCGDTPLSAVEDARQKARAHLEAYAPCADVQVVSKMDQDDLQSLLGWLRSREHQHTNSNGETSYNFILPEELFDMLMRHLEGLQEVREELTGRAMELGGQRRS
jgi:hypothetical protein